MSIKTPSLFKIISLVLIVLCFIMMFLPWITMSAFGYSESINLFTVSGEGCFWTVMLVVFEILFFIAMVLAIFGILTDRNLFVLPVAVLAVLMFLFDVFAASWAKGQAYGLANVHAGVGAWLFLVFGLAACGVLFYEDYSQGRNFFDFSQLSFSGVSMPKVNMGGIGGWVCTSCGAKNGASQNFCSTCGAKKPEPRRCAACGALLKPGEAFCSNCGTRAQ